MATTYTLIIGKWAVNRYTSFNATLWDLGLMTQSIWNTAHGRILHESVNLGFSVSRLAVAHWEFIYLPIAIIYRVFPSVSLLLYLQTTILASGIVPIYLFSVKKLESEPVAIMIAIAYLFYPALHGTNLFDLHGLSLATTFLLFSFYYLDQGSLIRTTTFAILSICCREDVAFVIFMIGLYAWWIKRQWKLGIILITLSFFWIGTFFLRGYFLGYPEIVKTSSVASSWTNLSESWSPEYLTTFFKTSLTLMQSLFTNQNIKYIIKLLLPVLGFCLLSPGIFLLSLPTLLLNMLSAWPQMHQIEYHYTATITPFIFLASIQGLANLKSWLSRFSRFTTKYLLFVIGSFILIASIISTLQFSILRFHKTWRVSEADNLLSKKLKQIPAQLSISTTARAGAHVANRQQLYHFAEHASDADVVILEFGRPEAEIKDLSNKSRTCQVTAMNDLTRKALQDTTLGLRFEQSNVFCLQRGIDAKSSFANYAFQDNMTLEILNNREINVGPGLFFLGWSPVYIGAKQAHFKLYWKNDRPQLQGADLNFYSVWENRIIPISYQPIFGRISIDRWPIGKIIRDHLFFNRPENYDGNPIAVTASFSSNDFQATHYLFSFKFSP